MKPWGKKATKLAKNQERKLPGSKPVPLPAALKADLAGIAGEDTHMKVDSGVSAKPASEAKSEDTEKLKGIIKLLEDAGESEMASKLKQKVSPEPTPEERAPARKKFNQAAQFLSACREKVDLAEREVEKVSKALEAAREVAEARKREMQAAETLKDKIFQ
eukprot:12560028-Alexandrium_andersonii.AAC.1